ncbi:MAG TPA: hypothetical protein GXX75_02475 [Clostridiales bacterium]|nr:hypothetical protein [Clostridiales bacterium]
MAYIGLDIGTSGCKASIITEKAEVVAAAHAEYSLKFPRRGFVELDPLEIYAKVKQVLKELSPKAGSVKALSLASFGEAFVLLDECDVPLHNFITYADSRCKGMEKRLSKQYTDERIFDITGVVPNETFSLFRLLWLRDNCPGVMEKARSIYLANDYYNYLLSGSRGVDAGTASKTLLFDIHLGSWSEELLEALGLPGEWFSPVLPVGTFLGKIRSGLAEELGLSPELGIYLGCHDQCSATIGGGVYAPGAAMIGEGSTESINLVVGEAVFQSSGELVKRSMCVEPFLEKGLYLIPASFLTYGNALRWYIRTFEAGIKDSLEEGEDIYAYLEKNSREDTELIFLPHLSKVNIMDPESKVPGAFIGITLDTDRWEFYRAVLQGLNFESRINLDTLQKTGFPIGYLSATGGITKSRMFMQLKADILKKEIHVLENREAGITGLAIICAVACGDYGSYGEAVAQFVRTKEVFYASKDYDGLFEKYQDIRSRLR